MAALRTCERTVTRAAPLAVCLAALLWAGAVARADAPVRSSDASLPSTSELRVERKYRVSALQVTVDLEQRRVQAEGDAHLSYDGIQLQADTINVDLEDQSAAASGDVQVSQDENALSASSAQYDLDDRTGLLTDARGHVKDLYFTAHLLQVAPQQMVLSDGSFTTCDEPHPHYRVTARQIIVRPGDRLISRKAALWYGNHRLLNLPNWSFSLRRGERVSPLRPIGGFSRRDGPFIGLNYLLYASGSASAELEARSTASRGLRARGRADMLHSWGDIAATVSRRDDLARIDLGLFAPEAPLSAVTIDRLPEVEVALNPIPVGRWGTVSARAAAGNYREQPSGVQAARGVGDLYFQGRPVGLGAGVDMRPMVGVRGVTYDTSQHRSATAYGVTLDAQPSDNLSVRAGYLHRRLHGAGPFTFDALDISREFDLGLAARLGPGWRVEILARRDLDRETFRALDAAVIRVAHCLEYGVTWRKVGGEFGLRFGLARGGPAQAPSW
jgi:opacity protein-like surface antigen